MAIGYFAYRLVHETENESGSLVFQNIVLQLTANSLTLYPNIKRLQSYIIVT